jgi:hypothetical protein
LVQTGKSYGVLKFDNDDGSNASELGQAISRGDPSSSLTQLLRSPKFYKLADELSYKMHGVDTWIRVNDPSAGSPTETLLRLLLPLNDQV